MDIDIYAAEVQYVGVESFLASFENVTATVNDTDFRPGTAYTITLTFRQGGISLTAAITPWKEEDGWGDIIM